MGGWVGGNADITIISEAKTSACVRRRHSYGRTRCETRGALLCRQRSSLVWKVIPRSGCYAHAMNASLDVQ